jgi:hypothetical protein
MIKLNLQFRTLLTTACALFISATSFGQYCDPIYVTGTGDNDYINGVELEGISNVGSGVAITGTGYSDYTYLSTDLNEGMTYTMTLTNTPNWGESYSAWIDYDQSGSFDADENLGIISLLAGASGTLTFTTAADAMPGTTRMRVRCIYPTGAVSMDPCASATYGEAEDYTIDFGPASEFDLGVSAITAPVTGGGLAVESITVTVNNYGTSDASGFNVEYSVDGGATVSEAFPGTIAAGASASFTFATTYDFTEDGCYSITAATNWDSDLFEPNNDATSDVCNLCVAAGNVYYMLSNTTGGEPWFTTVNSTAMNTVFTAGGWSTQYYETVDVATAFSPSTAFIFMEGSDGHAIELENFLVANMAAIEAWVFAGGRLFLNAAPNEGDGMSFGFGGVSCNYTWFTATANAIDPGHPIFAGPYTPVVTTYTGTSFGHASISGGGAVGIMEDAAFPGTNVLSELPYGDGLVVFGGMTTNNYHSPLLEAANLRANILSYSSCGESVAVICEVPGGLFVDGITENDAVCHWNAIDGADQYRFVLQNTATGVIAKRKAVTNSYDLTDKLDPLTTYAFRVKTVCYDDLEDISAPSPWYYWTTLGRIGEVEGGVSLYPNPNSGAFTINIAGLENNAMTLFVSNSIGQVVYTKTIDINSNDYTEYISLDNVTPGMYQVTLSNEAQNLNYSIVVTE